MNHFNIRLTAQEMDYIANVLTQRPWVEVNVLLANLKQQIEQAQKEAAEDISMQRINQVVDHHMTGNGGTG